VSTSGESTGAAAAAPVDSPEVDTLIRRLDEALGHDGQLL